MEPKEKGYQQVNGIRMYYEVYGSGKPLVLIHGGGSSMLFDFKEIISRLEGQFQLIGIDLQNHGMTDHRDIPETFEQDAHDIAALLKALHIGKAFFWGFSNGGNTVMQVARLYPEITEKLIIASAFYKRNGMMDGFFESMAEATLESMPEPLKINFLNLNPDFSKLENLFDKDRKRMQTFKDWDDEVLSSIDVPALLIGGDKDVMKPEHIVEMWRLIPDSQLMILPATHGSYMMADFEGNTDSNMINLTVSEVVKFLNH
ncbi:alpha/beta hydrolase [Chryseobacterium shigense]|uniref:Pimeloyl-ACP methyl ester carboxylesterase n=1 Tax=Chryseobacterium shigense TaxID=297244 RepID=A0A1N7HXZ0_9FLAO|nr:alpha/beta hydrolase [Chryseobacterium shigense]PQA93956.1 alpha/beta hydrolase [Chryseobacterium shigense]SIS29729.1 Pimeloyl-ACP methyl ester carboxylesterase [Chryseobacterium shigense]